MPGLPLPFGPNPTPRLTGVNAPSGPPNVMPNFAPPFAVPPPVAHGTVGRVLGKYGAVPKGKYAGVPAFLAQFSAGNGGTSLSSIVPNQVGLRPVGSVDVARLYNQIAAQDNQAKMLTGKSVPQKGPSLLSRIFDLIQRPLYGTAGAIEGLAQIKSGQESNPQIASGGGGLSNIAGDIVHNVSQGLEGKTKTHISNLLQGLGNVAQQNGNPLAGVLKNRAVQGIGGLVGDLATDPTTYVLPGVSKGLSVTDKAEEIASALPKIREAAAAASDAASKATTVQSAASGVKVTKGLLKTAADNAYAHTYAQGVKDASAAVDAKAAASKAFELKVFGKNVIPEEAGLRGYQALKGATSTVGSHLPQAIQDTGNWASKVFSTSHYLPGATKAIKQSFEGAGAVEYSGLVNTYTKLVKDAHLNESDLKAIATAMEGGSGDIAKLEPRLQPVAKRFYDDLLNFHNDAAYTYHTVPPLSDPASLMHYYGNGSKVRALKEEAGLSATDKLRMPSIAAAKAAGLDPEENALNIMAHAAHSHFLNQAQELTTKEIARRFGVDLTHLNKDPATQLEVANELKGMGFKQSTAKYTEGIHAEPGLKGQGVFFDPEVHKAVDYLSKWNSSSDPEVRAFLHTYDKVLGKYKFLNTVVNPGFHMKHLLGGMFANWYDGVRDPMDYIKAQSILDGGEKVGVKAAFGGEGGTEHILNADRMKEAYQTSGAGSSFYSDPSEVGTTGVTGVSDKLRQWSQKRENFVRMAHYVHALPEEISKVNIPAGLSPVEHATAEANGLRDASRAAAQRISKYNINYRDLTPVEKNVLSRVVPFYTFLRHNIPMQLETLALNPHKIGVIPKGIHALQTMLGTDKTPYDPMQGLLGVTPRWMLQTMQARIRNESPTQNAAYVDPRLPFGQLNFLEGHGYGGLGGLASQLTPLLSMPFELATKKDAFTGANIPSFPQYLASKLPWSQAIDTAFQPTPKGGKMPPVFSAPGHNAALQAVLDYLTKQAGIRQVTPQQQLSELKMEQQTPKNIIAKAQADFKMKAFGR